MADGGQALAVKTTCPYCGVGCGVDGVKLGAREVSVAGDALHPSNFGRLCSKGAALGGTVSLEGRLLHPEIGGQRVTSPETFETRCPFDWDRKLADMARGDAQTAALAAEAASAAFPAWAALTAAERGVPVAGTAAPLLASMRKFVADEEADVAAAAAAGRQPVFKLVNIWFSRRPRAGSG